LAASLLQAWLASLAAMINPRRMRGFTLPEPLPAVLSQRASVNDLDALEELIASLPPSIAVHARSMTKITDESSGRMRYVELLRSAYVLWFRRVDSVFTCTTFRNIRSIDQAHELWDEIEKLSTPDTPIMQRLHAKVTGLSID
jgi:hypothetical protein